MAEALKVEGVGADLPVRPPLPFAIWCGDLLVDGDNVFVVQDPQKPKMERSDILGMIMNVDVNVVEHSPLERAERYTVIIFPDVAPRDVVERLEEGLRCVCNGGLVAVQTKKSAHLSKKLLARKCRWTQKPLTWRWEADGKDEVFYVVYTEYVDQRRIHGTIQRFKREHPEGQWYDRKEDGTRVFIKSARIMSAKGEAMLDFGACADIWEETELIDQDEDPEPRKPWLQMAWLAEYLKNKELIAASGDTEFPAARTIYIVGAGPSLENNYRELANVKEGLVLCVNKSLTKLWSHGIKARNVITSDIRCAADWGLGVNVKEVTAWMGVHTGHTFADLPWKARNWFRMQPNCKVNRESKKDFPHLPCLVSGVSTTACATSLAARALRKGGAADPMVVFVGQDMCYPGGQYHAKGAEVPHDSAVLDSASKELRWLRGLDGKWYWTAKAFYDARIFISIQSSFLWRHGVRVVNASESPAAALRVQTEEGKLELLPLSEVVAQREGTERRARAVRVA